MPRPYRRFIPGRGKPVHTTVTALSYADLTKVDGETVLAPGEYKIYEFDLRASLRTYNQRKTFERLVGSRAIEVEYAEPRCQAAPEGSSDPESSSTSEDAPLESASSSSSDVYVVNESEEEPAPAPAPEVESSVEQPPPAVEPSPVAVAADADRLSLEDRQQLLLELGLSKKLVGQLLKIERPTPEGVRATSTRFALDQQLLNKTLEILSL